MIIVDFKYLENVHNYHFWAWGFSKLSSIIFGNTKTSVRHFLLTSSWIGQFPQSSCFKCHNNNLYNNYCIYFYTFETHSHPFVALTVKYHNVLFFDDWLYFSLQCKASNVHLPYSFCKLDSRQFFLFYFCIGKFFFARIALLTFALPSLQLWLLKTGAYVFLFVGMSRSINIHVLGISVDLVSIVDFWFWLFVLSFQLK